MKRLGVFLMALSLTAFLQAQDEEKGRASFFSKMAEKNILNHMDIGASVGTMGIGIDVAVPVGDYVRVRAGYNYMPAINFHSKYDIQTRGGSIGDYIDKIKDINIDNKIKEYGLNEGLPEVKKYLKMAEEFRNVEPKDNVTMGLRPNLHQFKFLIDVMPFKNNKHWSFTTGFFAGPSEVGNACNLDKEILLLRAVNAYNNLYVDYLSKGMNFAGHGEIGKMTTLFTNNGIAGVPLGYFADGKKAMMVPGEDNTVRAEMKVSKFRPYLGFGYNTHLSKDKKWNLNVDAGILFLCGAPSVYVDNVYKIDESALEGYYEGWDFHRTSGIGFEEKFGLYYGDIVRYNDDFDEELGPTEDNKMYIVDEPLNHVDMVHDLHDIPGKVGNKIKTISRFKVYPNVSVTFSYRIF